MSAASNPDDNSSLCLAAASAESVFFDRMRLSRHLSSAALKNPCVTTSVRNYTLKNIVLDTDLLILFQRGQAIQETVYFEPASSIRHLPQRTYATTISDSEDLIFGYNNAHAGYQHCLTQCIPAID